MVNVFQVLLLDSLYLKSYWVAPETGFQFAVKLEEETFVAAVATGVAKEG